MRFGLETWIFLNKINDQIAIVWQAFHVHDRIAGWHLMLCNASTDDHIRSQGSIGPFTLTFVLKTYS